MSLNLNPDIEARLNAMAQASGITVKVFLERIVEERSGLSSTQRLSQKTGRHSLKNGPTASRRLPQFPMKP